MQKISREQSKKYAFDWKDKPLIRKKWDIIYSFCQAKSLNKFLLLISISYIIRRLLFTPILIVFCKLFGGSLALMNTTPDCYVYPESTLLALPIIPYPGCRFSERLMIVPPEVVAPKVLSELSRRHF